MLPMVRRFGYGYRVRIAFTSSAVREIQRRGFFIRLATVEIATIEVSVEDSAGQAVIGISCGDLEASIALSAGVAPGPLDTGQGGLSATGGSGSHTMLLLGGGSLLIVLATAIFGSLTLRNRKSI